MRKRRDEVNLGINNQTVRNEINLGINNETVRDEDNLGINNETVLNDRKVRSTSGNSCEEA